MVKWKILKKLFILDLPNTPTKEFEMQFVTQINIQKKKMPLKVHDRTLKLTFH